MSMVKFLIPLFIGYTFSIRSLAFKPLTKNTQIQTYPTKSTQNYLTPPQKKLITHIPDEDIYGKCVFVRCDLNVPLTHTSSTHTHIEDDTRIRASIPTLKYLLNRGAKVLACTHLGRPKNGPDDQFSLRHIAPRLSELLGSPIHTSSVCVGNEIEEKVKHMNNGELLLLENVRFSPSETKNEDEFSKQLAKNVDIFVNDAFGTAHRAHSSTAGIAKYVDSCVAGFLLNKELDYLQSAINTPIRPFTAIIGGSKVSSKLGVLLAMLDKVDRLIIGGAMVFTFFKSNGMEIGNSIVEDDKLEMAQKIIEKANQKGIELILPVDVVVADKFAANATSKVVDVHTIPHGWIGLDNGPKTTQIIQDKLKDSKTILWNGPLGVSEWPQFANGTVCVMKTIADMTDKGATTIIGGGDSVAAVERFNLTNKFSHISTGGGASLELLEGVELPGVAVLDSA